ncbi:MAG: hypothetical protein FJX76_06115 [Armatimonadetes bacterium]|nr:hypothetical protein [Armatimonadota bacterium]
MSGICGWMGNAPVGTLDLMLEAIDYRGDQTDRWHSEEAALGYRWWGDRPGKSPSIHRAAPHFVACAGSLAPPRENPAAAMPDILGGRLDTVDGAFVAAHWDAGAGRLTLIRDPFGVRSLYYLEHGGVLYFASELKQLLAIPNLPIALNYPALHKYLTFSFVPGEDVPIRGVRRLLPGQVLHAQSGGIVTRPYFILREEINPALGDRKAAVKLIRSRMRDGIRRRLNGESEVAVFLSGGIDSSAVAHWLTREGVKVRPFSLDFGRDSVEKEQAATVASTLGLDLQWVPMDGSELAPVLMDLVWKLDLPFGDAVTGPQYLLARRAREAGLSCVYNGEGGDQLFGGWTSKPMIAAELYSGMFAAREDSREARYLRSYHRFYGREDLLYSASFHAEIGPPGTRRALLAPYLESGEADTFLNRVRLADIHLKGSQNILPRAERTANGWGIDVRVPLFDRALAETSFQLPPEMKLHGACEKYVLKLIMSKYFPREIVWRKKFGMSVPITRWTLGPLAAPLHDLLSAQSLKRRDLFRPEYVATMLAGRNDADDVRRRRVGERLWCLAMLEAWLRIFVDGKGRRP